MRGKPYITRKERHLLRDSKESEDDQRKRMRREAIQESKARERGARPKLDPHRDYFETADAIDFDHYLKEPKLEMVVGFRLLFGMEPRNTCYREEGHPLYKRLKKAYRVEDLPNPLQLETLVKWADEKDYPVHPDTYQAVMAFRSKLRQRQRVAKTGRQPTSSAVSSREHNTLRKLLAAIADKHYPTDPALLHSNEFSKLARLTEQYGHPITAETIRSHLRSAWDDYPKQAKDE